MKILDVYDSIFGNTEKIAGAIHDALKSGADVDIRKVNQIKPAQCSGADLLVVGSPTRAFSPTPAIKNMLKHIHGKSLNGIKVAAFDTRMTESDIESGTEGPLLKGELDRAAEWARKIITSL